MKLSLLALFASFAVAFAAKGKTYLVTFPNDTPQTEVDEAANEIEKSGGVISDRYTLLKGFSVVADPEMINILKTPSSQKYSANVEEDRMVYALGGGSAAA